MRTRMYKLSFQIFAALWIFSVGIQSSEAVMYVWKDPDTGSKKMSNLAPEWYRNPAYKGKVPRTWVYSNGGVIDKINGKSDNTYSQEFDQKLKDISTREALASQRYRPTVNADPSEKSSEYSPSTSKEAPRVIDATKSHSPFRNAAGDRPEPGSWDDLFDAKWQAKRAAETNKANADAYNAQAGRLNRANESSENEESTNRHPSTTLCPNGKYVSGNNCYIAPDGTYVGGRPQIAPDGTYVGGTPQIAPDGTYVGGRPQIAPNGRYVGQ